MEVSGQLPRPGRFTPRERVPRTQWRGGWMGPRAVLDTDYDDDGDDDDDDI
jgi:hypothetical protein